MAYPKDYFNPAPPLKMHLDVNSCFATIEQQANPFLRHKPIAVAANTQDFGCIVAPSIEAKKLGIKTGTRVGDAKKICPNLFVLPPDTDKYRSVFYQLKNLLSTFTTNLTPLSIDEFNLDFQDQPDWQNDLANLSSTIKQAIQNQIGDYLTVSVGLAPCYSLAKLAANRQKPDGFTLIDSDNFLKTYSKLDLKDLPGINHGYTMRLYLSGIDSVVSLYQASPGELKSAFGSVVGYDWYLKLRGWPVKNKTTRKSFSNSHVLPEPIQSSHQLKALLHKLLHKSTLRAHQNNFLPRQLGLYLSFIDGSSFRDFIHLKQPLINTFQSFKLLDQLLEKSPSKTVKKARITLSDLVSKKFTPQKLFQSAKHQQKIASLIDEVNQRFGTFSLVPARLKSAQDLAPDRISFGKVA